jgi:RNA polymerase sigma factor (sigma-70 family)
LFVKDNYARTALVRNKLSSPTAKIVNEVMRGIHYMSKRYGSEEDIRQTVDLTFLQCVTRYQRKDSEKGPIPFSAFLYSYFFYLLKKNVDVFLIDQLGRKTFPLITDENYDEEDGEKQVGFRADPIEVDMDFMLAVEEIDEMWVLGTTAAEPFDQLSVQERQLLKWRYVDGKRSSEIASKITEHPNTVREHLSRIRERIADIIITSNLEDLFRYSKKQD